MELGMAQLFDLTYLGGIVFLPNLAIQVTSHESNSPDKKEKKKSGGEKISPRNTLVNKIKTGKPMLCHSLQCHHCLFLFKQVNAEIELD